MKISDFKLERYFAEWEFKAPWLLCSSDCESMSIGELLSLCGSSSVALNETWLGYTETAGAPRLRKAISTLYKKTGPESILVHAGAEEAIFTFFNATLSPQDHVIAMMPAYQSLYEIPRSIGCTVSPWELHSTAPAAGNECRWELDFDELRSLRRENTKMIVCNFPHNPTGYLPDRAFFDRLCAFAEDNGIILFSDEVYRFLEYDEKDRLPAAAESCKTGVSLGVMSKSFGLAGLRIGWLAAATPTMLTKTAAFKDYTTICASAPSEFLATAALEKKEAIIGRNLDIIANNRKKLDEFFVEFSVLFDPYSPKAGPISFPRLKANLFWKNSRVLAEESVNEVGTLIMPGEFFDLEMHFRLGFGRKNFSDALLRFAEYLRKKMH